MKDMKSVIGLSLALGMVIYAVPRLEIGQGYALPAVFGIVWLALMLLIIAAHLHRLLGVDEETRREMAKVKKFQRWKLEQAIRAKVNNLQTRK